MLSSSCSNNRYVAKNFTCADLHQQLSVNDSYERQYSGHYKIGKSYKIKSTRYTPYTSVDKKYAEHGKASWYADHSKTTANGDIFNKYMLTAAHTKLPIPSIIKVTNLKNQKQVIVMVNDRGPFCKGRILDLSEAAAQRLEFHQLGLADVKIEYMHNETTNFLKKLDLAKKHGSKTAKKAELAPRCSIKCYLELINAKYDLIDLTADQKKLYQQSIVENNI